MQTKLENFKKALEPYIFYWEQWTSNNNCNLSDEEIEIIEHYIKSDFQAGTSDLLKKHAEIALINSVLKKLEMSHQVFVLVVVTDFLHSLLKLAKSSPMGFDNFLNYSITDLDLPANLKAPLLNFKVHNISMLFAFYKGHEFLSGSLYKHITDFMIAMKTEEKILTNRELPMERP